MQQQQHPKSSNAIFLGGSIRIQINKPHRTTLENQLSPTTRASSFGLKLYSSKSFASGASCGVQSLASWGLDRYGNYWDFNNKVWLWGGSVNMYSYREYGNTGTRCSGSTRRAVTLGLGSPWSLLPAAQRQLQHIQLRLQSSL